MFTPKQLAERAGVSANLIYGWCQAGLLPHVRLGAPGKRGKILIAEQDWAAFLAARRVEAPAGEPAPARPGRPVSEFRHLRVGPLGR